MLEEMRTWKRLVQSSQKTFLSLIPLRYIKTGSSLFHSSRGICFLKSLELQLLDTSRRVSLYLCAVLPSAFLSTCY